MVELAFDCVGVRADPYAAGPTLLFTLRVAETSGEPVYAIALRCQLRIEPHKRRYSDTEAERLGDLFGDRSRWADTLKPMQLATVPVLVPAFTGSVEVDVPVPCTYDLDVAAGRYFHAVQDGTVPVLMLFSGTVFTRGATGFGVAPVPWHKEAAGELPMREWRAMMDRFFPGSGWLRLDRATLDALAAFKSARGLATWEQAVLALLDEASRPAAPS